MGPWNGLTNPVAGSRLTQFRARCLLIPLFMKSNPI